MNLIPKVSIIIATYNRAHFIGETLNTIIAQSFENWECIIVDDGCTDGTVAVLDEFLRDGRFQYYKRPLHYSKGCPGSRNYGLTKAKGSYILFFDDDDFAHPDLLKNCINQFNKRTIDFCRFERRVFHSGYPVVFEFNHRSTFTPIDLKDLEAVIINKIPFNSCQVMWRKECFKSGAFRPDVLYADDWECYSRLISNGASGGTIDDILLFARKHDSSSTAKFKRKEKILTKAVTLANESVIENLVQKNLISENLFKFFLRRSFAQNDLHSLKFLLKQTKVGYISKLKYLIGFKMYFLLKPFFRLKSQFYKI